MNFNFMRAYKKIIIKIVLAVAVVLFVFIFRGIREKDAWVCDNGQCVKRDNSSAEMPNGSYEQEDANSKADLIKVSNLVVGQLIKSPLIIEGEARGNWYFEANFPVRLLDENDNLIATAIAQAQGDWMTEDFAPFRAELIFDQPVTETGALVLEKDNPSGLPENSDELKILVRFNSAVEATKVKVYFNNSQLDPEASCDKVFAVEREVSKTQAVARAALTELLKGTISAEETRGYFSSINQGVKIQSLTIEDGIALVDFNEQLESQVGGSCRVSAIRAQITETLKQFPTVEKVIISINGRTEDILQP